MAIIKAQTKTLWVNTNMSYFEGLKTFWHACKY